MANKETKFTEDELKSLQDLQSSAEGRDRKEVGSG